LVLPPIPSGPTQRLLQHSSAKRKFLLAEDKGTAMSLIIDSFFTGNKLDESFTCNGTITAKGKGWDTRSP
jgi:hypothetical protein